MQLALNICSALFALSATFAWWLSAQVRTDKIKALWTGDGGVLGFDELTAALQKQSRRIAIAAGLAGVSAMLQAISLAPVRYHG